MNRNPSSDTREALQFGPYSFELETCRLYREDVFVHLTPKACAVLSYLLRRPGRLITKDEFLDVVWEGVSVREESLTQAISAIRLATGDSARSPRFIETVFGEGYRFIADVKVVDRRADRQPADARNRRRGVSGSGRTAETVGTHRSRTILMRAIEGLSLLWSPAGRRGR